MDTKRLHTWFFEHARELPWRESPTPYAVWISEVMLQQTRAEVVVPYFLRWMQQFPDVHALAAAPLERVIKTWEGLGYYSRARSLHAAAKKIVAEHGGQIPSTPEALRALPGLGPYTTGAVLSFGFHQRAAAVDGNVLRVMARYAWVQACVDKAPVRRQIETLVEQQLDREAPWITMEALIELGATVCTKSPRCAACPLRAECRGAASGNPEALPVKAKPPRTERLQRSVALIEAEGCVLVRKNSAQRLMQDLAEFPYFEGRLSAEKLRAEVEQLVGARVEPLARLDAVTHTFTRYHATLWATRFRCAQRTDVVGWSWVPHAALAELAFSAGHRQLLRALLESHGQGQLLSKT